MGPRPTKFGACAGPGILLEVRLKINTRINRKSLLQIAVLNFRMTLGLAIVSRDFR